MASVAPNSDVELKVVHYEIEKRDYERTQAASIAQTACEHLQQRGGSHKECDELYSATFNAAMEEIQAQTRKYEAEQGYVPPRDAETLIARYQSAQGNPVIRVNPEPQLQTIQAGGNRQVNGISAGRSPSPRNMLSSSHVNVASADRSPSPRNVLSSSSDDVVGPISPNAVEYPSMTAHNPPRYVVPRNVTSDVVPPVLLTSPRAPGATAYNTPFTPSTSPLGAYAYRNQNSTGQYATEETGQYTTAGTGRCATLGTSQYATSPNQQTLYGANYDQTNRTHTTAGNYYGGSNPAEHGYTVKDNYRHLTGNSYQHQDGRSTQQIGFRGGASPSTHHTEFRGASPSTHHTEFRGASPSIQHTEFRGASPSTHHTEFRGASPSISTMYQRPHEPVYTGVATRGRDWNNSGSSSHAGSTAGTMVMTYSPSNRANKRKRRRCC